MINVTKKKLLWVVEIIIFIIFMLLCFGLFYLIKENKESKDDVNKEVLMKYIISNNLEMSLDIKLEKEEQEEIYGLLTKLEFGPSETECIIEKKYYFEYDDNELYLDEDCGLAIYNDKQYSVKNGERLAEVLKEKINNLNNVYLFNYNQEKQESIMIDLSEKDKNEIRELWSQNEKNGAGEVLDLALILNYVLVVDDDMISIQDLGDFVYYSGEYIKLSDDLYNKLAPFMNIDILRFKTEDYNREIEEFGPLFNMYVGDEIKSREDAINNAKRLWKEYLKFDTEDSLFELQYQVSYDTLNDNYLVFAYPIEERILGGGATVLMKRTGEVVMMRGEN